MRSKILAICAFFAASVGVIAGNADITVIVDGSETKLDSPVVIRENKAYIGLRSVTKLLENACVKWDDKTKTAVLTVGNKRTRIAQAKGLMIDGVFYLPLRDTAAAVGCTIEWDSQNRTILITTEPEAPQGGG